MTALSRYQRLECPGHWRETPEASPREVIVSFGDSSLILSELQTNLVLTHWSLPAVERIGTKDGRAIYSPDPGGRETLEIDEPVMIDAIHQVRRAIEGQRPAAARLRRPLGVLAILGALIAAIALLPDALARHTAAAIPRASRTDIAQKVLKDLAPATGPVCSGAEGQSSLDRLWARLTDNAPGGLLVVPGGIGTVRSLPDGRILIHRDLIERQDSPEVVAGYILAERARTTGRDPLEKLLHSAGSIATLRLLATGDFPQAAAEGYARDLLSTTPAPVDTANLLAAFARAELSSTPYAHALDPAGTTTQGLIEGDPLRGKTPPLLLSDAEWIRLQSICDR